MPDAGMSLSHRTWKPLQEGADTRPQSSSKALLCPILGRLEALHP
jgi:hypothetical protein